MTTYSNVIFYELTMNSDQNLMLDSYLKVAVTTSLPAERIVSEAVGVDKIPGGASPPGFSKHNHIDVAQRRFSLKVENGHNIYAIQLASKLECQFGPGTRPLSLFSPGYIKCGSQICHVRHIDSRIIVDFENAGLSDLAEFNWFIFDIDRDAVVEPIRLARDTFRSHLPKHRHAHANAGDQFALPFYFNLYDKRSKAPFWVHNDHDNPKLSASGTSPKKRRYHGGAHPNSNAFLIIE